MARLTMKVNGRNGINWNVARHVEVQSELRAEAQFAAFQAMGILGAHRHDGHARIETDKGKVDHYVVLSDERGQKAAMTIEYGRRPAMRFDERLDRMVYDPGHPGVAPLRKAVGLL